MCLAGTFDEQLCCRLLCQSAADVKIGVLLSHPGQCVIEQMPGGMPFTRGVSEELGRFGYWDMLDCNLNAEVISTFLLGQHVCKDIGNRGASEDLTRLFFQRVVDLGQCRPDAESDRAVLIRGAVM